MITLAPPTTACSQSPRLRLATAQCSAVNEDEQAVYRYSESTGERILVSAPDTVAGEYDLVLANILARPLIDLAGEITPRLAPGGTLVLSGILSSQVDSVVERYAPDVAFADPASREDWVCLTGRKRDD